MADEIFSPKSHHIESVTYNTEAKTLGVKFLTTGKTYIHTGVPPSIFHTFKMRRSAGGYYHGSIKSRYKLLGDDSK